MQFQTLAFTAFCAAMAAAAPQQQAPGGGSSSQLAAQLPTCALPCFQEGSAKVGCTAGDFACTCTKLDAFTQVAAPCFAKACKPEELVAIQSAASEICKAALTGAGAAGPSSSAAAPAGPSATASASSSAKASASATASATSPATASASAPASASASASATPKTAGGSRAEAGAILAVAAVVAMAL
ncbi:hypothetical protein PG999_014544 [Apiospora kogelbergensis]|uniref:CFEM domain-containing protein n=1 Tax=Apiospora kogelbergensis TaxID=1337665 RepID=A0AAW0QIX8_9PEZI